MSVSALLVLAVGGGAWWLLRDSARMPPLPTLPVAADYVGAAACKQCHETEFKAWAGSHHAARHAGGERVHGARQFRRTQGSKHSGVESRFFKRDGKFMVRTDGPDGTLADFEIQYTFGVWPLQQYLIEFPGGRYQALGIAWDARAKGEGGQRWFHLYPSEKIDHKDRCTGPGCIRTGTCSAPRAIRPI